MICVCSAINIQPYIHSTFTSVSQTLILTSRVFQWHHLGFGYQVLLVRENVSANILISFSYLTVYVKLLVTLRSLISSRFSFWSCQRDGHMYTWRNTVCRINHPELGASEEISSPCKRLHLQCALHLLRDLHFPSILWREMATSRAPGSKLYSRVSLG